MNNMIIKENLSCLLCGNKVKTLIGLPNLPITGVFSNKFDNNFPSFNQELQFCNNCNHAQLKNIIDPDFLYSDQYSFSTSNSSNSKLSTEKFLKFINTYIPMDKIKSVLEFGCNDLHFLKKFSENNIKAIGIDPILKKNKEERNLHVIADYVENINLKDTIQETPSLIFSQHTIEHILNPIKTLKSLKEISNEDTLFAFEFPNFDLLVQNRRYDQIFHEHIHYFSLDSFVHLLHSLDFELINYEFNHDKWGTIYVLFKNKTTEELQKKHLYEMNETKIVQGFIDFKNGINITKNILSQFDKNEVFAYGASLMLPTLNYHFDGYLATLNRILDDDINKKNQYYINLDIMIDTNKIDIKYEQSIFLVTALEHSKNIIKTLTQKGAKKIIVPINIF